MFWWIERTRMGAIIRAAAEKPEMVDVLGIDARRVHMAVFAIGTALALIAGVLAAPLYSVYPNMGDGFLIISFVVVVIGGLGSVSGAFWSALIIGLGRHAGEGLRAEAGGARRLRADGRRAALAALGPVRAAHMRVRERAALMLPRGSDRCCWGWARRCWPCCRSSSPAYYVELGTYALIAAMLALACSCWWAARGSSAWATRPSTGSPPTRSISSRRRSRGLSILVTLPRRWRSPGSRRSWSAPCRCARGASSS